MIYRLPTVISKESIYYKILPDMTEEYRYLKKGEDIVVSLIYTEVIYSNAVPLFAAMLTLLKNKIKAPIYLEMAYSPKLLGFLSTIDFFNILYHSKIIDYDKEYLFNIRNYNCNKENKILTYSPVDYNEKNNEKEKIKVRDLLAELTRRDLIGTTLFKKETSCIDNDELWQATMTAATELIVNARIYSGSKSYYYVQSNIRLSDNKRGYLMSIVDVGSGYYTSLGEKIKNGVEYTQEDRDKFYKCAQKLGICLKEEINFLSIMEALYYSETRSREMDLYKLKQILAHSHTNFRIHQKNREVVFGSEKCYKCNNKKILQCLECIWKRRNQKNAPIKRYPIAMAGIHIEIEFIQEKKNV